MYFAELQSLHRIDAEEVGAEHELYRNKRTLDVLVHSPNRFPALCAPVSGVQGGSIFRFNIDQ